MDEPRADEPLAVVIFSKDRPCQLLGSLLSLLRHLRGVALDISVLYKASLPAFAESYSVVEALLRQELYPGWGKVDWHWVEETSEATLGKLLDSTIARIKGNIATVAECWFSLLYFYFGGEI